MSRLFASTDNLALPNLGTMFDTDFLTFGAWVYPTASTPNFARIIRTPAQQFGYWDGAGGQTYAIGQGFSGGANVWESVSTNPILNQWALVIAVLDGRTINAQPSMYVGDISNAMSAQTMVQVSAGVGTRSTGFDYGWIGGEGSTLTWPGRIAMPFVLPWAMTADEAERFRGASLSPLYANGTTNIAPAFFFFDLAGSSVASYVDICPSITLTVNGTSSAADPLTINATRPAGAPTKVTNKVPAGSITPAGALDVLVNYPLTGTITPTGSDAMLLSRTFAPAGITPTGALTAEFVDGSGRASRVTALADRTVVTHRRPFRWPTYSQRTVLLTISGPVETPLAVSGAITPTGAVTKQTNKFPVGALTPAGALDVLIAEPLTGTITPAGAVDVFVTMGTPRAGALTPAGAPAKVTAKVMSGAFT